MKMPSMKGAKAVKEAYEGKIQLHWGTEVFTLIECCM